MSYRRISPILALLAALVLIAGPAPTQTTAAPVQQLQKVAYGADFAISGTTAPIYIAIEKGYFAEGGIEVTVSRGIGSADAVKRAATGNADIVQGDIGTAMLLRSNEGAEVKVVAPLYDKTPGAVLYYSDQGISTPKDLEGRTLADGATSAPRQLFPAFAAVAGIDMSKIEWRTVDPATRNAVFAAGQLEIITAFILNLADAEILSARTGSTRTIEAMRFADHGLNMYGNGYITSDKMLAERPEAVRAFVEGAAKGLRDTYLDVPAAVQTVIRNAPEANVDPEIAARQLELIRDIVITDNSRMKGIGAWDDAQLQATKSVMMQYLGMQNDIALTDIATPDFLPATPVMP